MEKLLYEWKPILLTLLGMFGIYLGGYGAPSGLFLIAISIYISRERYVYRMQYLSKKKAR